jgi:hypothetical protein
LEPFGGKVDSVSIQKEKLEKKKAKLLLDENRLKDLERKKRTRRLIELGGLIVKAELDDLGNNTLLGALLSLTKERKNESLLKQWKEIGAHEFETSAPKNAFIITFPKEPNRETKSQLRDLNFKWNQFRKEWYGYGTEQELRTLIEPLNGIMEPCIS